MKHIRPFTDEDRQWLINNYPHLTNRACIAYLHCGYYRLKKLVAECGLTYKGGWQRPSEPRPERKVRLQWHDEGACGGVCMDCRRYRKGGECEKTGRYVGALWQKKCFK